MIFQSSFTLWGPDEVEQQRSRLFSEEALKFRSLEKCISSMNTSIKEKNVHVAPG